MSRLSVAARLCHFNPSIDAGVDEKERERNTRGTSLGRTQIVGSTFMHTFRHLNYR